MRKLMLIISIAIITNPIYACTTFSFFDTKGNIVFGRNFDFPVGEGHIHINKKNLQKTALLLPPEKPMRWVSKYGSITFNQAGKEFPYGGMNEMGLVIEQMWLQETTYPSMDERHGISELQWIQYQLDNSKSVTEIIASDTLLRISNTSMSPLHFLVADANGNIATIEFIDGSLVVHKDESLPYPVLANCTYNHSLEYKSSTDKNENKIYNEWTLNSSGRFATAASLIDDYKEYNNIIDYSFYILDSVAQQSSTQWSIVYDITNKAIFLKTMKNPNIQKIEMKWFNYSCNSNNIYANIGDEILAPNNFQELTYEANLRLLNYIVLNVDYLRKNVPVESTSIKADYADKVVCSETKTSY